MTSTLIMLVAAAAACLWPSDDGSNTKHLEAGGPSRDSVISASRSVVSVPDTTLQAGFQTKLTLQFRDSAGRNLGLLKRVVEFVAEGGTSTGRMGKVNERGDGSYDATFAGALAGTPTTIHAVVTDTTNKSRPISLVVCCTKPITVVPGPFSTTGSELSIAEPDLWVGDTTTVTLVARDGETNLLVNQSIAFTVASPEPGTVGTVVEQRPGTYTAMFTAARVGWATIAVMVNGQETSAGKAVLVTYDPKNPPGLTVMPRGATITGGPVRFSATVRDSSGNVLPVSTFHWASLNPYVATINESTGEVSANTTSGQVIISATANGLTGYAVVNVASPGGSQASSWSKFIPPWEVPYCDGGTPYIRCPRIFGLWGSSPSDVYAGGSSGIIYHYDGNGWLRQATTGGQTIGTIWGSAGNDVYAVAGIGSTPYEVGTHCSTCQSVAGTGTTLHYDGAGWSSMGSQPAAISWGAAPNDLYGSGGGHAWHYDGRQWSMISAHNRVNIWGLSAVDIYASENGVPYHYDGHRWSVMPNAGGVSCTAFWGTSPSNVYCVSQRQVWRFNGTSWTALNPPVTIGLGPSGTSVLWRISGTSETDIYVVGAYAQLFGFDGTTWRIYNSHFESDEYDLNNVWAVGGQVFSVGDANYGYRGAP